MQQQHNPVKNTIGFDELLHALQQSPQQKFPPHSVVRNKESKEYTVSVALAGYQKSDVSVVEKADTIVVSSVGRPDVVDDTVETLHRGIATRSFKLTIPVHESLEVTKASFDNGMLTILVNNKQNYDDHTVIQIH